MTFRLLLCGSCELVLKHCEWLGFFSWKIMVHGQNYNLMWLTCMMPMDGNCRTFYFSNFLFIVSLYLFFDKQLAPRGGGEGREDSNLYLYFMRRCLLIELPLGVNLLLGFIYYNIACSFRIYILQYCIFVS